MLFAIRNVSIKRIIQFMAVFTVFLVIICCTTAVADETIVITDRAGLEAIADNVRGNYVLGADIDMSGSNWETISYFGGTFDGANHTITGLTINTQVDSEGGNVGLFGYLDGTISRVHFRNVDITARATNGFCAVCVFGSTGSAYGGDPRTDPAHVIDCSVSGQIRITGSGDAYCGAAAFVCAQNSSADLRITIDAYNFNEAVLWNCVNCSATGSMDITVSESGNGSISLIQSSLDCTVDMECAVSSRQAATSLMPVYGIYGKDIPCENCTVNGSISYPGRLYGIYGCVGCVSNLWLTSDCLTGLSNCRHCIVSGTMGNAGKLVTETLRFIEDVLDGSAVTGEEEEFANRCTASYNFCTAPDAKSYRFDAFVGRASSVSTSFSVPAAGQANVTVNIDRLSEEYDVYCHGDVDIKTTTGNINYYCNTANDGNISLSSQSGTIEMVGGSSNAGDLTASSSAGEVSVTGGLIYNEGSVTASSDYKASAIGVDGDNAVNRGSITASGASENEIAALGAKGENSWNQGSVSASNLGIGPVSAVGCNGGVNEGSVRATAVRENATAFGIRNGIFNSGSVYASTSGKDEVAAHANGTGSTGDSENDPAINVGTVTAYNSIGVANAYAQGGKAIAGGYWAYANGKEAVASSHGLEVDNSTGDKVGWIRVWHSDKEHDCISPPPSVIAGVDEIIDNDNGFAHYDVFATAVGSGRTGEKPAEPEACMPEEEIRDDSQLLAEMHVYAGKDGNITDQEIDCLYITKGSYSFNNPGSTDYRLIGVSFDFWNPGEDSGVWNFHVTLPDGFSFKPYIMAKETDRAVRIGVGKANRVTLKVYPIYNESPALQADFVLTGDIRRTFSITTLGSGGPCSIYCRPTGMMNPYDSSPVIVQADYSPVSDLANAGKTQYNPRLAVLTCALSQAVYNANGSENTDSYISRSLNNLGFSCLQWYGNTNINSVAYAIAQKKVLINGEIRPVLLVIVRGTVGEEWIGNLLVSKDSYESYHASFRSAADDVLFSVETYCRNYALPVASTRAVITGHSRGAAVADLVAHDLNTSSDMFKDLVAYTYAAPSCTKNPVADSNIFNIIYAYDVVGYMPYQGFGKYGKNYYIGMPGKTAPAAVQAAFERYSGIPYENVGNDLLVELAVRTPEVVFDFLGDGRLFGKRAGEWAAYLLGKFLEEHPSDNAVTRAHSGENYIAWVYNAGIDYTMSPQAILEDVMSRNQIIKNSILDITTGPFAGILNSMSELNRKRTAFAITNAAAYTEGGSYFMGYECPVNVEVYDESGNLLGAFQDHNVIAENDDLFLFSEETHDFIVAPADRILTLRVTGTGEGSMYVVLSHFDGDAEDVGETGSNEYIEIPVHTGEVFELQLRGAGIPDNLVILSSEGNVYFPQGLVPATQLRLPANLTEIGEEAFSGDGSIAGMIICPVRLTGIGANAFTGTNITHIFIPRNVTSIDNAAFGNLTPTVYCFAGSSAETFAREKDYPLVLLDSID